MAGAVMTAKLTSSGLVTLETVADGTNTVDFASQFLAAVKASGPSDLAAESTVPDLIYSVDAAGVLTYEVDA